MPSKSKAYKEGWLACTDPPTLVLCPYFFWTEESVEWHEGYRDHCVRRIIERNYPVPKKLEPKE